MDWQTLIGWKREKRKEERGKRIDPVLHLLTYTVFRFCFCDCTYASVSNRILVPVLHFIGSQNIKDCIGEMGWRAFSFSVIKFWLENAVTNRWYRWISPVV